MWTKTVSVAITLFLVAFAVASEVGHWRDDDPLVGSHLTLHESESGFMFHRQFDDGTGLEIVVDEVAGQPESTRRFDVRNSDNGEFFIINEDGDLEIHDEDGLVKTAEAI